MNSKGLLCAGLLAGMPLAAFGYGRVGVGFNFGFPLYDYPPPSQVVVVHQPYAAEAVPSSPGPDYVWVAGHWEWDTPGNRWIWYGGAWQKPPTPASIWQAGYWSQQGGNWVWVGSHWASPAPQAASAPPPAPQAAPTAQPAAESAPPQHEIVVNEAPPPPIAEEPYTAPGTDYVWIPGVWTWNGAWIWAPGHYVHPPHPGAAWEMGSWQPRGTSWVWTTGHWR